AVALRTTPWTPQYAKKPSFARSQNAGKTDDATPPTIPQRSTFTPRPFRLLARWLRGLAGHSRVDLTGWFAESDKRRRRVTAIGGPRRGGRGWGAVRRHRWCQQHGPYGRAARQRCRCVHVLFGALPLPTDARPTPVVGLASAQHLAMSTERDVVACQPSARPSDQSGVRSGPSTSTFPTRRSRTSVDASPPRTGLRKRPSRISRRACRSQ